MDTNVLTESAASFFREVEVSSTLKMEAPGSAEILVLIYQFTQYNIPEDSKLNIHLCDNFKSVQSTSI
jgi:hypothetical protein